MLLGTMLNRFQSETTSAEMLEALGDLVLLSRIEAMSATHEETLGEYATNAASRFANLASDEDWLALMTKLEQAEEPARACLLHMVEWALKQDASPPAHEGCTCGNAHHASPEHPHG